MSHSMGNSPPDKLKLVFYKWGTQPTSVIGVNLECIIVKIEQKVNPILTNSSIKPEGGVKLHFRLVKTQQMSFEQGQMAAAYPHIA